MTVMIIEDDEGIAQALSAAMELRDYTPIIVKDPRETLEKCLENKPDIIFLDLLLSGMDGRETAIVLKNSDLTKDIPIIMMSAHPSAPEIAKVVQVNAFLPKPFSLEQVYDLIDQLK